MAFTRKALRARSAARKGIVDTNSYLGLLQAGGRAYRAGQLLTANPHPAGEDAEIWAEGWVDERDASPSSQTHH